MEIDRLGKGKRGKSKDGKGGRGKSEGKKVNITSGRVRKVRVIRTLAITLQLTKPAILR